MIVCFDIPCLDLRPRQEAIREKYGERWFASDDATLEAAALWGISGQQDVINVHGVFLNMQEETLAQAGRSYAQAEFAQAPNGLWAIATRYQLPQSGFGYAPSVWSRRAFPSRDTARLAAVHDLILRLSGNRKKDADKLLARLEAEKTPQLSLF